MKLFHSPASPYVRKVMAVAHLVGLTSKIELLASAVTPVSRDETVFALNPLGKVPTLITDDGVGIFDSRVICEYLASLGGDTTIFPAAGPARWRALVDQATADGLMDAALLARYEGFLRPAEKRWAEWEAGQIGKINSALAVIETTDFTNRMDIGAITTGCALGYLDFRFNYLDWRKSYPKTAAWFAVFDAHPAMAASAPIDPNAKK
jgi:glutathione S-transferase